MAVQGLVLRCALLVGAAVALAGCQGHVAPAGSLSATPPAASTTGSSGGSSPACTAADLALELTLGDAAAGSRYPVLRFTNVGNTTCAMAGFPGVSYVAGDDGHQVGAAATRTGGAGGPVTLAHGQTASAQLQEANTQNFAPEDCHPVPVRGFRVYAPNDTAATFVSFGSTDVTACSSMNLPAGSKQLFVKSVTPGAGE